MLNPNDPMIRELSTPSSEEYYQEMYDFGGSYDPLPIEEDTECPQWVQDEMELDNLDILF